MKYSTLYPIVAGLALGALLLPDTALAEKKTPFTSKETDTSIPGSGDRFMAGGWGYLFGGKSTHVEDATDPRVAGTGWFSAYAAIDLQAGAATFWGQFHIENAGGAWDGYWTGSGAPDGLVATLVGSGAYEGLVSRWTSTSHGTGIVNWSGYIVENGPGYVPLKVSGWRNEQLEPLTFDTNGPVYIKASLYNGGGRDSHIGVFTDLKKIGLVNFVDGRFSGSGTIKAANGDLINWVVIGNPAEPVEVFLAGGTGRFDHAVGSFSLQMEGPPASYTYGGPGKVRY